VLLLGATVRAEDMVTAGEALDVETCRRVADEVKARIETWCRMKYRRPVPVTVQPRASWERALKQTGYAGEAAKRGAAFYDVVNNYIIVVPWVIGGYREQEKPPKLTKQEWVERLESTIIHELMHALHCQNFYIVLGGADAASLRVDGLTEREKDLSTVDFLIAEGMAELAAARTSTREARMLTRLPEKEISSGRIYWHRYQPDGKRPFRVILFDSGYQDGLDLLNMLARKAGPRALRAVLYRPPPRALLFQPKLLAKVDLDDPPDPDSILAFLSPDGVKFGEVYLAVSPGNRRYFRRAATGTTGPRSPGCLLGYTAVVGGIGEPHGKSSYAFFIADPDEPGTWSAEQAGSLREEGQASAKRVGDAEFLVVKPEDGSLWVRAESRGLVVLAHETKPTPNLEERVRIALKALEIRRPRPAIYRDALKEASRRISAAAGD